MQTVYSVLSAIIHCSFFPHFFVIQIQLTVLQNTVMCVGSFSAAHAARRLGIPHDGGIVRSICHIAFGVLLHNLAVFVANPACGNCRCETQHIYTHVIHRKVIHAGHYKTAILQFCLFVCFLVKMRRVYRHFNKISTEELDIARICCIHLKCASNADISLKCAVWQSRLSKHISLLVSMNYR